VEDPNYDRGTLKVAEGMKDRHKQDALYVRIAADGGVASTPAQIMDEETETELERAQDYLRMVRSIASGEHSGGLDVGRFEKIVRALRLAFGTDTTKEVS
jgi:hypothetical protein